MQLSVGFLNVFYGQLQLGLGRNTIMLVCGGTLVTLRQGRVRCRSRHMLELARRNSRACAQRSPAGGRWDLGGVGGVLVRVDEEDGQEEADLHPLLDDLGEVLAVPGGGEERPSPLPV
jgi:hypothetical protein